MSILSLDDRGNSAGLSSQAMRRQPRFADERSIRPVLERLRRAGVADESRPLQRRKTLGVELLVLPEGALDANESSSFMAHLAIGSAIAAGLAVAVVMLTERGAADNAFAAVVRFPNKVQTVSFVAPAKAQGSSAVASQSAPADETGAQEVKAPADSDASSASPFKQWAMIPAEMAPASWNPIAQDAQALNTAQPVHRAADERKRAESASAKNHARQSQRHRTPHAAQPLPMQPDDTTREPDQAVRSPITETMPIKKMPIQAALDSLLGRE